ncbi:c-type cytochrome [Paraburkholderia oxyphila]|uniref:c-type cytochrome n=1 Tax=Paraburkholderia oxyphila TaxID=614212 RepID=UPI0007C4F7AF|nr:c-type cytochrome [Paraburkholderia oxyphila]
MTRHRGQLALVSILAIAFLATVIWAITEKPWRRAGEDTTVSAAAFQPPPDSAIPNNEFGEMVREGKKIFANPGQYASGFVGNKLSCVNCHLSDGRQANSAPLWAAYVAYPAYRSKNEHVNTFAERLQGCFQYSMNGKAPPLGDRTLVALESYAYFLAKGVPTGEPPAGRGYPALPAPALAADYNRGAAVYSQNCAVCHGANGEGKSSDGHAAFPPLWGAQSYNWGAGLTAIDTAAAFVRANMPLGMPNSLTVQQAWDVATYIDSQVRPQDPRFTGDVAQTRKQFHDSPYSAYGTTVNGVLLGAPDHTPPFGTVPVSTSGTPAHATGATHDEQS